MILFVYFLPVLFLILCIKEFLYKTLSFLIFNVHASLSSLFILRFSGFWRFLNFFVRAKWVPLEFSNYESKTCEKSGNKTYYCLIWVKNTLHKVNILSYLDHTFQKCVITKNSESVNTTAHIQEKTFIMQSIRTMSRGPMTIMKNNQITHLKWTVCKVMLIIDIKKFTLPNVSLPYNP